MAEKKPNCEQPNPNESRNTTPKLNPNDPTIKRPERNMPAEKSAKGSQDIRGFTQPKNKRPKTLGSFAPTSKNYEELYLDAIASKKNPHTVKEITEREEKNPDEVGQTYEAEGKKYVDIKNTQNRENKNISDVEVPQTKKFKYQEFEENVVHRTKEENAVEIAIDRPQKYKEETFNTTQAQKGREDVIIPTNERSTKFNSSEDVTKDHPGKASSEVEDFNTTSSPKTTNEEEFNTTAPTSSPKKDDGINTPPYQVSYKVFNAENITVNTPTASSKTEEDYDTTAPIESPKTESGPEVEVEVKSPKSEFNVETNLSSKEKSEEDLGIKDPGIEKNEEDIEVKDPGIEKSEEDITAKTKYWPVKDELPTEPKDPGIEKDELNVETNLDVTEKEREDLDIKESDTEKSEQTITEEANPNAGTEQNKAEYFDDAEEINTGSIKYEGKSGYRINIFKEQNRESVNKVDQSGETVSWDKYSGVESPEFEGGNEPISNIHSEGTAVNKHMDYSQSDTQSRYGKGVRYEKDDGDREEFPGQSSSYYREITERTNIEEPLFSTNKTNTEIINRNTNYSQDYEFSVKADGLKEEVVNWNDYKTEGTNTPNEIENFEDPIVYLNDFVNSNFNYSTIEHSYSVKTDGTRNENVDWDNYNPDSIDQEETEEPVISTNKTNAEIINRNISYPLEYEFSVKTDGLKEEIVDWNNYKTSGTNTPNEIDDDTSVVSVRNSDSSSFINKNIEYNGFEVRSNLDESEFISPSDELSNEEQELLHSTGKEKSYSKKDYVSLENIENNIITPIVNWNFSTFEIDRDIDDLNDGELKSTSGKEDSYSKKDFTKYGDNLLEKDSDHTLDTEISTNFVYYDEENTDENDYALSHVNKSDLVKRKNYDTNLLTDAQFNQGGQLYSSSNIDYKKNYIATNMILANEEKIIRDELLKLDEENSINDLGIDKVIARIKGYINSEGEIGNGFDEYKSTNEYKKLKQHIENMKNGESGDYDFYLSQNTIQESVNFEYPSSYLLTHRTADETTLTSNAYNNLTKTSKTGTYEKSPGYAYPLGSFSAVFSNRNEEEPLDLTLNDLINNTKAFVDDALDVLVSGGDDGEVYNKAEDFTPDILYRNYNFNYDAILRGLKVEGKDYAHKNHMYETAYENVDIPNNAITKFLGVSVSDFGNNDYEPPSWGEDQDTWKKQVMGIGKEYDQPLYPVNREIYYDVADQFLDLDYALQLTTTLAPDIGRTFRNIQAAGSTLGDLIQSARDIGMLFTSDADNSTSKILGNISNNSMDWLRREISGGSLLQRLGTHAMEKEIYDPKGFRPLDETMDQINDTVQSVIGDPFGGMNDLFRRGDDSPQISQKTLDKLTRGVQVSNNIPGSSTRYYYNPPSGTTNPILNSKLIYTENIALSPSHLEYGGSLFDPKGPYIPGKSKFSQYRAKIQADMVKNISGRNLIDYQDLLTDGQLDIPTKNVERLLNDNFNIDGLVDYSAQSPFLVDEMYKQSILNNFIIEYGNPWYEAHHRGGGKWDRGFKWELGWDINKDREDYRAYTSTGKNKWSVSSGEIGGPNIDVSPSGPDRKENLPSAGNVLLPEFRDISPLTGLFFNKSFNSHLYDDVEATEEGTPNLSPSELTSRQNDYPQFFSFGSMTPSAPTVDKTKVSISNKEQQHGLTQQEIERRIFGNIFPLDEPRRTVNDYGPFESASIDLISVGVWTDSEGIHFEKPSFSTGLFDNIIFGNKFNTDEDIINTNNDDNERMDIKDPHLTEALPPSNQHLSLLEQSIRLNLENVETNNIIKKIYSRSAGGKDLFLIDLIRAEKRPFTWSDFFVGEENENQFGLMNLKTENFYEDHKKHLNLLTSIHYHPETFYGEGDEKNFYINDLVNNTETITYKNWLNDDPLEEGEFTDPHLMEVIIPDDEKRSQQPGQYKGLRGKFKQIVQDSGDYDHILFINDLSKIEVGGTISNEIKDGNFDKKNYITIINGDNITYDDGETKSIYHSFLNPWQGDMLDRSSHMLSSLGNNYGGDLSGDNYMDPHLIEYNSIEDSTINLHELGPRGEFYKFLLNKDENGNIVYNAFDNLSLIQSPRDIDEENVNKIFNFETENRDSEILWRDINDQDWGEDDESGVKTNSEMNQPRFREFDSNAEINDRRFDDHENIVSTIDVIDTIKTSFHESNIDWHNADPANADDYDTLSGEEIKKASIIKTNDGYDGSEIEMDLFDGYEDNNFSNLFETDNELGLAGRYENLPRREWDDPAIPNGHKRPFALKKPLRINTFGYTDDNGDMVEINGILDHPDDITDSSRAPRLDRGELNENWGSEDEMGIQDADIGNQEHQRRNMMLNMSNKGQFFMYINDDGDHQLVDESELDSGTGYIAALESPTDSISEPAFYIPFQFTAELTGEQRAADWATETAIGRTAEWYLWSRTSTRTIQLKTNYVVTAPSSPGDGRTPGDRESNESLNFLSSWDQEKVIDSLNKFRALILPLSTEDKSKFLPPTVVIVMNNYLLTSYQVSGGGQIEKLSRWVAQDVNIDPQYDFGVTATRDPIAYEINITLKEVFPWTSVQTWEVFNSKLINTGE